MLGLIDRFFLKIEGKPTKIRVTNTKRTKSTKNVPLNGAFSRILFARDKGLDGWKDDREGFKIELVNDIKTFLFGKWENPVNQSMYFSASGKPLPGFCNIAGKPYHSLNNRLILEENAGNSPFFLTVSNVANQGGTILDKEKVCRIISFIPIKKKEKKLGDINTEPFDYLLPKPIKVINAAFCKDVKVPAFTATEFSELELSEYVENVIKAIKKRLPIILYDSKTLNFYRPSTDEIHMCPTKQFKSTAHYYSTLFHEIIHSTKKENRTGRAGLSRAIEELVAEMGALVFCSALGLNYERNNSITYLKGWLDKAVKKSNRSVDEILVEAYDHACEAADFLLKDVDIEKLVPKMDAQEKPEVPKKKVKKSKKKVLTDIVEIVKKVYPKADIFVSDPKKSSKVIVSEKSVKGIFTDEKRFQNRKNAFSEDSKNRIVKAVENGSFDWAKFDPILIWFDKKAKKWFVLSGHSRLAAFIELVKTRIDFANIPCRVFEGSESAAIEAALNSNTLSTKETDVERATYYYKSRQTCELQRGLGAKNDCEKMVEEQCREREGKNAPFILNLSYLSPDGVIMEMMHNIGADKDNDSTNILRTVANWTGEARRTWSQMTDAHENEIAHFLLNGGYGSKKGQFKKKTDFMERLRVVLAKWNGKAETLLNIAGAITVSSFEHEWQKRLNEAQECLNDATRDYDEKHKKYLAAQFEGKIDENKRVELEKPLIDYVLKCKKEVVVIQQQQGLVRSAEKQQTSLFGFSKIGTARKTKIQKLPGDLGKFLGGYERCKYSVVLRGDKGAGKSRLLFQIVNAFAAKELKCAIVSLEMSPNSSVMKSYTQYIEKQNKKFIEITDYKFSYDELSQACKQFDVVAIDSWTKLKGMKQDDFDRLQNENPETILLTIFQSTTGKVTRGGNMPEFDASTVIHVHTGGVAECEKNRYGNTDSKYLVFEQKIKKEDE